MEIQKNLKSRKRKITHHRKDNHNKMNSWHLFTNKVSRRQWDDVLKVLEVKCHPRISYTAKLSLKHEGQIKVFLDKQQLKEFFASIHFIHEMLKVLQAESKWHQPVIQIHMKKQKNSGDDNYLGNEKDSIIAYFFFFLLSTYLKSNYIKQQCTVTYIHCWSHKYIEIQPIWQ